MKNKKINKLLATTMATAMLIMPLSSPAHAIANEDSKLLSINDNVSTSSYDNVPIGTEVVVTDAEMEKALREAGVAEDVLQAGYHSESKLPRAASYRAASYREGVNRCVKVRGGYDIYLSKQTLNTILIGGKTAATSTVSKLIPGGWGIAAASLAAMILYNVEGARGGKIFRVREKSRIIGAAGEIKQWYVASTVNQ